MMYKTTVYLFKVGEEDWTGVWYLFSLLTLKTFIGKCSQEILFKLYN